MNLNRYTTSKMLWMHYILCARIKVDPHFHIVDNQLSSNKLILTNIKLNSITLSIAKILHLEITKRSVYCRNVN